MAGRPPKTTADWFPHDTRASQGKTLSIIFSNFSHEGLSAWWLLLEAISVSNNQFIVCRNSIDWEFLAAQLKLPLERAKQILDKLAALDAIDPTLYSAGIIWSQNLVDRLAPLYDRRKQKTPDKPSPKLIYDNNNSFIDYINGLIAQLSPADMQQITLDKIRLHKNTPPYPPPPARVAAAASFEDLSNRNGLFTELATKFPSLDLQDELHKCSLWWSTSKKKVKSPELAFRNWLQKAVEIQSNGERKESPAQRAAREYIETNQI